jgi:quercetin dioxygenase-like cupin family protein
MVQDDSRRNFLRAAPLAAAFGLSLPEAPGAPIPAEMPLQVFTAAEIEQAVKATQAVPGNRNLVDPTKIPLAVVITTETGKSAAEFEWHEGRDHLVQMIDGTTLYEVGGTPKNGRMTKPGEWLAAECEGSRRVTLKKGDMLLIPRNTPHKRSTAGTMTMMLISSSGKLA